MDNLDGSNISSQYRSIESSLFELYAEYKDMYGINGQAVSSTNSMFSPNTTTLCTFYAFLTYYLNTYFTKVSWSKFEIYLNGLIYWVSLTKQFDILSWWKLYEESMHV